MKKSNFVALILGVIGTLFLGLGMCMTTIPEWEMFDQGIVVGVIGLVVLLITGVVHRKMEGKAPIKVSAKTLGTIFVAILGALAFGVGMCLTMVFSQMILGIVIGVVGIIILVCLIPLTKGLK